jgi:hypothetical protein
MKSVVNLISEKLIKPTVDDTNQSNIGPVLAICDSDSGPGKCWVDAPGGGYYVDCDAPPSTPNDGGSCC